MKSSHLLKLTAATLSLSFACADAAFANYPFGNFAFPTLFSCIGPRLGMYTLDCAHWYVAGNIGVSHLYDTKTPNTANSVNQNGPGWNAALGYQVNSIIGAELGYTQYHPSRETIGPSFGATGSTTIAKTEHYAAYLAATGRYPLCDRFSALGKLGIAYSYANKIYTFGPSASSGSVSLYYGLGLAYSVTQRVDLIGQWARTRGNDATGSADLYSLGATFAIV